MEAISETSEQKTVIEFCDILHIPVVHIPNEGKRSKRYGAELRKMGMRKGFPDLFFPAARNGFHGLLIEMKKSQKEKPTKDQKEWIDFLNDSGYCAAVCYGADEAIAKIRDYFGK